MPKLHFLNVDLDMIFKKEPKVLLGELEGRVAVLYSGEHPKGHLVALELNSYTNDLQKTFRKWIKLLGTLSQPAKRELKAAFSRVFDVGFDVALSEKADRVELPEDLLEGVAQLNCSYAITLYAADPKTPVIVPSKRRLQQNSRRKQ